MTLLQLFTLFHTALSIVAIISGLLVVKGLISSAGRQLWTLLFFVSAWATTGTGFFFPFNGVTPAFALGLFSLIPLTLMYVARYRYGLRGKARGIYVISSVLVFYFNCFVLVVQSFRHIPELQVLAPTESEPPFQIAQLLTLVLCTAAGYFAFKRYHLKRSDEEFSTGYTSPHAEVE